MRLSQIGNLLRGTPSERKSSSWEAPQELGESWASFNLLMFSFVYKTFRRLSQKGNLLRGTLPDRESSSWDSPR